MTKRVNTADGWTATIVDTNDPEDSHVKMTQEFLGTTFTILQYGDGGVFWRHTRMEEVLEWVTCHTLTEALTRTDDILRHFA